MKIIYKQQSEKKQLTFGDVKLNQFFVSSAGRLWQKVSNDEAQIIASSCGIPLTGRAYFSHHDIIERLIPEIEKIEF